ncbi:MAG: alpha/beta fold hydrolase, partial [Pseudomonadota bacterium]
VHYTVRQVLDMFSPSNFPFSNPEILSETHKQGGVNFINGINNVIEDMYRIQYHLPPVGAEKHQVGKNLAITPGKVIYQNELIELIQYEPTTAKVYAEPILIIPAWIMKYYILDLSPHNSLVKYLVGKGHTVFMISWKNPSSADRNLRLEDYLNLGIMNSLDVISKVLPKQKIHAAGYCLGGTLLMIAAAAMAHHEDDRLKSITLFAAQVDFREPGELSLFIDQSQISYMEDIMWEKGYLDGSQMAWAFSMLRSNDLIWSRLIHNYLLGKRRPISDLMAWNYDTTRLPFRMHSQYLRSLFLNNDLVRGQFKVAGRKVSLTDIKVPMFVVSTNKDHVSPWRSVYKIHIATRTDITFLLTTGGHNVGIVNEPGGKRPHSYQMLTRKKDTKHSSAGVWLRKAPKYEGSWWPAWEKWLSDHANDKVAPPTLGNPQKNVFVLSDAPGTYIYQK